MCYVSKAAGQSEQGFHRHSLSWNNKQSYLKADQQRITAKMLLNWNMEPNRLVPEEGDVMLKQDHAAIVFRVWQPGIRHLDAIEYVAGNIPLFPGRAEAATQLNQTRYFRTDPMLSVIMAPWRHIDYVNHRGDGKPQKIEAVADVGEMRKEGFQLYKFKKHVMDNWQDWKATGDVPRR